jgi:RsiW-degrading membrane proteinase PrsW (M82 family)
MIDTIWRLLYTNLTLSVIELIIVILFVATLVSIIGWWMALEKDKKNDPGS